MESSYYFWQDNIKKSGLRFTGTRKAVLETILKNPGEYDARTLHGMVGGKAGIATIYRTLNLLKELGVISQSSIKNNMVNYRLNNPPGKLKDYGSTYPGTASGSNSAARKKHLRARPGKAAGDGEFTGKGFDMYFKEMLSGNPQELNGLKKMETRMAGWMKELNKLKREKEMELEDMIKDLSAIDKILEKHGYDKSNLIQMLLDIQEKYRWLPKHALYYTGDKLDIPLTNIYSIASFYKSFSLDPKGEHSIIVCTGTACHVRGAINLLQRIVNVLGIEPGDTTGDYKFTLETVNCLGCCALGPVMMIDKKYYSNPSTGKLKKIFAQF